MNLDLPRLGRFTALYGGRYRRSRSPDLIGVNILGKASQPPDYAAERS
jgi:hypothetical protein